MKDKELFLIGVLATIEDFIEFITFGFKRPTWSVRKAKARFTRLTIANVEKRRQEYKERIARERAEAQAHRATPTKEIDDEP